MQKTFYAQISFSFDQVGAKLVKIPLISLGSTLLGATGWQKHQQKVMPELSSNNYLLSKRTQVPKHSCFHWIMQFSISLLLPSLGVCCSMLMHIKWWSRGGIFNYFQTLSSPPLNPDFTSLILILIFYQTTWGFVWTTSMINLDHKLGVCTFHLWSPSVPGPESLS